MQLGFGRFNETKQTDKIVLKTILMTKFSQNSIIGYVLLSNIYWQDASL
jgi:hypothetical protein